MLVKKATDKQAVVMFLRHRRMKPSPHLYARFATCSVS